MKASYLPANEDGTECSETLAYNIQMPGNYPEGSVQLSEDNVSLKSRIIKCYLGDETSKDKVVGTCGGEQRYTK
jgi:hypothetical protein